MLISDLRMALVRAFVVSRCATLLVVAMICSLSFYAQTAFAQGLEGQGVQELLKGLQTLQESGSLGQNGEFVDPAESLDRARKGGAERVLGLDVGSVVKNKVKLAPAERFVVSRFCAGDSSPRISELMHLVQNFSALERDYCVRAGQLVTLFGYDIFDGIFSPELLVNGSIGDDYTLGIGDEIIVNFVGQERRSLTVPVNREGLIIVEPLKPIFAAGQTMGRVSREISRQVALALLGTEAFVSLGAVRQVSVTVVGEVARPGRQILTGLSSLRDAIGLAGGVSKTGSLRQVRLLRNGSVRTIDLYGFLTGFHQEDLFIRDGDKIVVPPIGATVAVSGAVGRPAAFEIEEGIGSISASEVLALAGGSVRPRGNRLTRLRVDELGQQVVLVRDNPDFELIDGDILMVTPRSQRDSGTIELAGHVRTPGIRSIEEAPTIASAIGDVAELGDDPYLPLVVLQTRDQATGGKGLFAINGSEVLGRNLDYRLNEGDRLVVLSNEDIRYISGRSVFDVLSDNGPKKSDDRNDRTTLGGVASADALAALGSTLREQGVEGASSDEQRANSARECLGLRRLRDGVANSLLPPASAAFFATSTGARSARDEEARNDARGENGQGARNLSSSAAPTSCPEVYEQYPEILQFLIEHLVLVTGEVRTPGLYAITPGASLRSVLSAAGGLTVSSDASEIEIARAVPVDGRNIERVSLSDLSNFMYSLSPGDTVSIASTARSIDAGPVVLRGEFARPGAYPIVRGERLSHVIARAGGVTPSAYPYGAVFTRQSVKKAEELALERLSRELNAALAVAIASGRIEGTAITALAGLATQISDAPALGRVVIEADPTVLQVRPELDVVLQPGDTIVMPKRPSSVIVTGDVLNPGALQFRAGVQFDDYIREAGGFQRSADRKRVFAVFPNGVAQPVSTSPFVFTSLKVPPGTTIVVPKDATPFNILEVSRDVAGIISQLAITAASLAVINN